MENRPACVKGIEIPKRDTSKKLVRDVKKIMDIARNNFGIQEVIVMGLKYMVPQNYEVL